MYTATLLSNIRQLWSHLVSDEEGADMAEYALVLVLIAVVAIVALTSIGTQVAQVFTDIATALTP
jgi:pilus assembly protein Flp/PilA